MNAVKNYILVGRVITYRNLRTILNAGFRNDPGYLFIINGLAGNVYLFFNGDKKVAIFNFIQGGCMLLNYTVLSITGRLFYNSHFLGLLYSCIQTLNANKKPNNSYFHEGVV